jgi:hypothetical protein
MDAATRRPRLGCGMRGSKASARAKILRFRLPQSRSESPGSAVPLARILSLYTPDVLSRAPTGWRDRNPSASQWTRLRADQGSAAGDVSPRLANHPKSYDFGYHRAEARALGALCRWPAFFLCTGPTSRLAPPPAGATEIPPRLNGRGYAQSEARLREA